MKSQRCAAFLLCLFGGSIALDKGAVDNWREPFEMMKTRIETMYAPLEDYFYESNGVKHGCRPFVHIPEEPPACFVTLLHGFTSCPDEFGHIFPDLAAAGCLVVVPAFPGHGFKEGGGRHNIPGFRITNDDQEKLPEPEKYFQFVFDVAQILSDANVSGLPNKMVGGASLGGAAAAMLTLCSDIRWDRTLIMNGAFELPALENIIAYSIPYSVPLSWNSAAIVDLSLFNKHTCKGEDKVTSPGYCDFYVSSMVSMFQFSHVIMGFWEAVPLFRQGHDDKAVEKLEEMMGHVLEMGGEGGSFKSWTGQHWKFAPGAAGQESSWKVWERKQPGRLAALSEMLRQGARHIAASKDMNIQVLGCGKHGDDGAVSKKGLKKFIDLTGADPETHFCAFPGGNAGMPHPWTRPYILDPIDRIFWWTSYARVAVTRFALYGELFQRIDVEGSDVCFVDAIADGDAEHVPFLGREYTARYPLFEPPALLESWKEFSFTGLECGPGLACETHVWKMGRAKNHFWYKSLDVFAVQPLLARFAGSSRPSDEEPDEAHHPVPMLVERDEPQDWSKALRRPIRAAWVKAPGDCEDAPFLKEWTPLVEGSEDGACLMVPLRGLMADEVSGRFDYFAKSLVAGALYDSSATSTLPGGAKESTSTLQFCGKVSEVSVLRQHICLPSSVQGQVDPLVSEVV